MADSPAAWQEELDRTRAELAMVTRELSELTAIGARLSAERDPDALLELILGTVRQLTASDAGAVFLIEDDGSGAPRLRSRLVHNDSRPVYLERPTVPVGSGSAAGHAALTGEVLNLEDAYRPPSGLPFQIDRALDEQTGYRTKSMLVVPMKTPGGDVIGVLQLINRKADPGRRFASAAEAERLALPYPSRLEAVVSALAFQAAVALENARLYGQLRAALREVETSQQRVIQGERLRALGEMAGGVAHDFNNVLAVVLGRTQLLLDQVADPELRRQLQVIEQVAQDGAQTIRRIQEFARMRRTRPFQRVDLNQVVRDAVETTRPRWVDEAQARGVTVDVRVEAGALPAMTGDPAELREVLVNLLSNALDAMPQGGRITLTTGLEGDRVSCAVADTGVGMSEEVRGRVFEPFFTTKAEQGTGLGLSIAYGIVTRHGGNIEVRSRPGQGSAFTIRFPVEREAPAAAPTLPVAGRAGRILVIEDEPPVREVLVETLARRGHRVVACADGRSGLERAAGEPFDVIMVDLSMPGMSGWEVVRQVRARPAPPRICLVTGWGDQIDPEEARQRGVDHVIAKPFDLESVVAVVTRVLSS